MKKGIAPAIAVIGIALLLIVLEVAFVVGSIWGRQHTEKRYLVEASLISKSDKVETYVRSFQRATDLSSLQAIHDAGTEHIVLPYDFSSSGYPQYSDNYKMAYWQIFDEENNKMPLPEIMLNKIRQKVSWISTCYLNDYLKAFGDFSQASDFEMTIPDPDLSPVIARATFDGQTIRVEGEEISFQRTAEVDEQEINIVRRFNPYSNVDTRLGEIIQLAWDIVDNDRLGNLVIVTEGGSLQNELDNFALNLEGANPVIDVNFEILDSQDDVSGRRAIINVSIYDSSQDYVFYSFPNDNVRIYYLGVNFLAKVGDSGVIGEKISASSLTGFDDCSGYSGLGIISPKDTADICEFFKVAPTICQDTDGLNYDEAGTCNDFTGFYEDTCVDDTLYEYYCDDDMCNYKSHDCDYICKNGACMLLCPPPDCQDLFDRVNAAYGASCGDSGYDRVADVDKDEDVDLFDVREVSKYCGGDGGWCQDTLNNLTDPCSLIEICDDSIDNDGDGDADCDDPDCAGNIACKNCDTDCNLCSSRPECLSSAAGCKWCTGPSAICLPQGSPVPPGYVCLL